MLAALGAYAANLLPGDPVWLLVVAPPGWGKTEAIQPLASLPHVHAAATMTEGALLSGTPKREAKDAKGGLLREIGDFAVILAKDFGSVLSMHRDARAALLAALREVYDGTWTRHVGTDGGKTLHWSGRVGLIAGCTPTIDSHHAVMGAMGERFVLYRMPAVDAQKAAAASLKAAGHETEMREQLSDVLGWLFHGGVGKPSERTEEESQRLIALAMLAVRARSAVERDGYSREVELIVGAESPARLVKQLARLLDGLDVIGTPREAAWGVVSKVALDCIPMVRRTVLEDLARKRAPVATKDSPRRSATRRRRPAARSRSSPSTSSSSARSSATTNARPTSGPSQKRANGSGRLSRKVSSWSEG